MQSRLDVREYSFSQRTNNVWNTLSNDCVHAGGVNRYAQEHDRVYNTKSVKRFERSNGLDTALYKNYLYLLFYNYLVKVGFHLLEWTLDKLNSFLVCCHLMFSLDSNLVQYC